MLLSRKNRFPWKEFIKSVAVIAVPVALQNLLTTTGSMVDTMMLAPLGELTVGTVGLCAQFTSLMFSFGCTGGQHRSVYAAQHLAEHIHQKYHVEVRVCHREQGISFVLKD